MTDLTYRRRPVPDFHILNGVDGLHSADAKGWDMTELDARRGAIEALAADGYGGDEIRAYMRWRSVERVHLRRRPALRHERDEYGHDYIVDDAKPGHGAFKATRVWFE